MTSASPRRMGKFSHRGLITVCAINVVSAPWKWMKFFIISDVDIASFCQFILFIYQEFWLHDSWQDLISVFSTTRYSHEFRLRPCHLHLVVLNVPSITFVVSVTSGSEWTQIAVSFTIHANRQGMTYKSHQETRVRLFRDKPYTDNKFRPKIHVLRRKIKLRIQASFFDSTVSWHAVFNPCQVFTQ